MDKTRGRVYTGDMDTKPNPTTDPEATDTASASERITTPVLSVRMSSIDLRRALTARCEQDNIPVAQFINMVAEAYLDDRLRIIKPPPAPEPSFLIDADADQHASD